MQQQSAADARIYRLLDELEGHMARKNLYALVNLTDEVIGISKIDIPDARNCSLARKHQFSDLGFKFPIGMFLYRRCGNKAYCFGIF